MSDRRFEARRGVAEPVELHWTDRDGREQDCAGVLKDLSRSGARIQPTRPVPLHSLVRLTIRNVELMARVKSCFRMRAEFVMGVQFEPGYEGILLKGL